jgi:hypothetical protein
MAPVEMLVIERGGMRLGVPAARVAAVADLPAAACAPRLQQRLGQPPLTDGERCFGLRVQVPGGETVVEVAGRVSIAAVPETEIAPLPALFLGVLGVAPVTAVVFAADAPVLVLDVDAMVAHARAGQ